MAVLKKIGNVVHISKTGNIIVSADFKNLPSIGQEVFNGKMEKIGFVYDIIGRINSPYLVVRPYKRSFIDEDNLFVVVKDGRGRKDKGNRKKGERKGNRKKGNRKRRGN